jgi:hypothetical protein
VQRLISIRRLNSNPVQPKPETIVTTQTATVQCDT